MCCGGRACPTGSETMSKTRLFNAIKSLDLEAVSVLLGSHPELAKVKDERRRNALHFLCGLPASDRTSARSLALARLLLDRGFDINGPAFVEGGARLDPVAEDETPFLGAIKWSRFKAAERLLHHGANVNFQNSKGMTALHFVVKKNSDRRHVEMLLRHGADPCLRDAKDVSPLDMVARRRDKTLFHLFSR